MSMNRRTFLYHAGFMIAATRMHAATREYDVRRYGAVGDGVTNDTVAIQKAINAASAAGGGRVVLRGGARHLCGALMLRSGIDFHLADDALLLAHPSPSAYPATGAGIMMADGAVGLTISGTGKIDGQAKEFVTSYSKEDQRWEPKAFRPRIFSLESCRDLQIREISFANAPFWGMHMLGCERVLVDGVTIRNWMDMPNCDGIDPDHCRNVEIRNCDIVCADDAICIKTTDQKKDFSPSHNILVTNCRVTSRDSGLKVGTETYADISKIRFHQCTVVNSGRGPTITHRQPGNISDIEFDDIQISTEHHAARWWGWGEAVSVTAWPRDAGVRIGTLRDIRLRNIRGTAENSLRIDGLPDQPITNVLLEKIDLTIDKWTDFPGEHFDNRPTLAGVDGLEKHKTPGFFLRHAANVQVKDCRIRWGAQRRNYYGSALEAHHVSNLHIENFVGEAAFPERDKAIAVEE